MSPALQWVLVAIVSMVNVALVFLALSRRSAVATANIDAATNKLAALELARKQDGELEQAVSEGVRALSRVAELERALEQREIRLTGKVTWFDGCPGPASADAAMAAFELEQGAGVLGVAFAVDGSVIVGAVHFDGAGWRAYARTLGGLGATTASPVQWSAVIGPIERAKQETERMLREMRAHEQAGRAAATQRARGQS